MHACSDLMKMVGEGIFVGGSKRSVTVEVVRRLMLVRDVLVRVVGEFGRGVKFLDRIQERWLVFRSDGFVFERGDKHIGCLAVLRFALEEVQVLE